jgi:hypothetical protein
MPTLHRPRFIYNSPRQAPLAEACCSCGILVVFCILICGQGAWEAHGISQNSPSGPGADETFASFRPPVRQTRGADRYRDFQESERWSREAVQLPVGWLLPCRAGRNSRDSPTLKSRRGEKPVSASTNSSASDGRDENRSPSSMLSHTGLVLPAVYLQRGIARRGGIRR